MVHLNCVCVLSLVSLGILKSVSKQDAQTKVLKDPTMSSVRLSGKPLLVVGLLSIGMGTQL